MDKLVGDEVIYRPSDSALLPRGHLAHRHTGVSPIFLGQILAKSDVFCQLFVRNEIFGPCKDSRYNSDISRYQI